MVSKKKGESDDEFRIRRAKYQRDYRKNKPQKPLTEEQMRARLTANLWNQGRTKSSKTTTTTTTTTFCTCNIYSLQTREDSTFGRVISNSA
jgi:hypothetical protein